MEMSSWYIKRMNLLAERLGHHPILADEKFAVVPLLPHILQLVVPHILHFEHENSKSRKK